MKKRSGILTLGILLSILVIGCKTILLSSVEEKENVSDLSEPAESQSDSSGLIENIVFSDPAEKLPDLSEPVEITMYFNGYNVDGADNEAVTAEVNAYLASLGVPIIWNPIWGNEDQKADGLARKAESGQPVDIYYNPELFTDGVLEGEWLRLDNPNNNLLKRFGKEVWNQLPLSLKYSAPIPGADGMGIYALPALGIYAAGPAWEVRLDLLEKYGYTIEDIQNTDYYGFGDILKTVKEGEGDDFYPLLVFDELLEKLVTRTPWIAGDNAGTHNYTTLFSYYYDPQDISQVVDEGIQNKYTTEEYRRFVEKTREYYLAGYIHPVTDDHYKYVETEVHNQIYGRYLIRPADFVWPNTQSEYASEKYGFRIGLVPAGPPYVNMATTNSTEIAISSDSLHPEHAMAFLNLLSTDPYLLNLVRYGIEGTHYHLEDERLVYDQDPPSNWNSDDLLLTPPLSEGETVWDAHYTFYDNAEALAVSGYIYQPGGATVVSLGQCTGIAEEYNWQLGVGAMDPDRIPELLDELEATGINQVITEANTQLDSFLAEREAYWAAFPSLEQTSETTLPPSSAQMSETASSPSPAQDTGGLPATSGPVEITMYFMGGFAKDGYNKSSIEALEAVVNAYLSEQGLNILWKPVFGDYNVDRETPPVQADGKPIDLYLSPVFSIYPVADGIWARLDDPSDSLLEGFGQELWEQLPQSLKDAAVVSGPEGMGIYYIPTMECYANYPVWNVNLDMLEKYGYTLEDITNTDYYGFGDILKTVKEGEGEDCYPLIVANGEWSGKITNTSHITGDGDGGDRINIANLLSYSFDSQKVSRPLGDGRLENLYATEEYRRFVEKTREYYLAGYIDPKHNSFFTFTMTHFNKQSGNYLIECTDYNSLDGLSGYAEFAEALWDYRVAIVPAGPPYVDTTSSRSAMLAVSASSPNPGPAMTFLNLLNTDPYLMNLLRYGIEGIHYKMEDDKFVLKENPPSYWGLTMDDTLIPPLKEGETIWDVHNTFYADAEALAIAGYQFDPEPVKIEFDRCVDIAGYYFWELETGSMDPDQLPELLSQLEDAGIEKVLEEANAQLDLFLAAREEYNTHSSDMGNPADPADSSRPDDMAGPTSETLLYEVIEGDCLWNIAKKNLGSGRYYIEIYELNRSIIDTYNETYNMPQYTIYPQQILLLPADTD